MPDHSDLARRGYDAELARHRRNLTRALDEAQRVADVLAGRTARGEGNLADEASRLMAATVDVLRFAAAVDAAERLSFAFDSDLR